MLEMREKDFDRSAKDIEKEKRKRERREEIYRNKERLFDEYWERHKQAWYKEQQIWLQEQKLERKKRRSLKQKKSTKAYIESEPQQMVSVVVEEKEISFDKLESEQEGNIESKNKSFELDEEEATNEYVEEEQVEILEEVEEVKRIKNGEVAKVVGVMNAKETMNNEEKSKIVSNIALARINFVCTCFVGHIMQEVDKDSSKMFLIKSQLFMMSPNNFKGVQVLEWKGWKRLIFDPGINQTIFYGGSEG